MKFKILDTLSTYRRMADAPCAETREAIFCDEIVQPFQPVTERFGSDGLETFRMWGMNPDQFAPGSPSNLEDVVEALAAYNAWNKAAQALEDGWKAFGSYQKQVPTTEITFGLMVLDLGNVPGNHGYSGNGSMPGYVMTLYGEASERTLPMLQGVTAHELHHNLMFAARPHNFLTETTVGDYMLMEGLAESFAAELYGETVVGPYVKLFDESRLKETKAKFIDAIDKKGFILIRSYIFGDEVMAVQGHPSYGIPAFAGYALGYRVVQAYLKRMGRTVAEATFVPTNELIAESGFFS
ncbi:MAG: DUF2268 domain-containing putative Zn-dependent protease [bacterium]|nr:DUF2268 domain-containing putative Zn-dependent protease [bacterium]